MALPTVLPLYRMSCLVPDDPSICLLYHMICDYLLTRPLSSRAETTLYSWLYPQGLAQNGSQQYWGESMIE